VQHNIDLVVFVLTRCRYGLSMRSTRTQTRTTVPCSQHTYTRARTSIGRLYWSSRQRTHYLGPRSVM